MYIPTIYNKDIDETSYSLALNDDKLHHIKNVLRVKNNSPIKVSNGIGLMYFGKFKDNKVEITSKKEYKREKSVNIFIPPIQDKTRFRFLIEKLGELSVNSITIAPTDYSQKVNINTDKIFNWLVSAIEQSGTPFFPNIEICDQIDFNKFNHALDIRGKVLDKFSYTSSINEFTFRTETAAIVAVSLML